MKKILLLIVAAILLAGCAPKDVVEEITVETTKAPEQTSAPEATQTEAPTATPAPTPDANPSDKLKVSKEEYMSLLNLWPIDNSPIKEHGDISIFTIHSQKGIESSTLNLVFQPIKDGQELVDYYMNLIKGDWEDIEYSSGPAVYDGLINDSIEATCQISTIDTLTEVFFGLHIQDGSSELDELFAKHWPIGLFEMHEQLSDDNMFFSSFSYYSEMAMYFSRSWEVDNIDEVIEYYKNLFEQELNYYYFDGDEYSGKSVKCLIDGVAIEISETMDSIEIILGYEKD